jgi:hypothetical protein
MPIFEFWGIFAFIVVVQLLFYCECYMSSLSYWCPEKERKSPKKEEILIENYLSIWGKKKKKKKKKKATEVRTFMTFMCRHLLL